MFWPVSQSTVSTNFNRCFCSTCTTSTRLVECQCAHPSTTALAAILGKSAVQAVHSCLHQLAPVYLSGIVRVCFHKDDCLPKAVGKQPSIPLIYLGRKWTLNWWWWWWWWPRQISSTFGRLPLAVLYPLLDIFPFQFQFRYWQCISIPFLLSSRNVFPFQFQFQLGKYFSFNFVLQVFPFLYQLLNFFVFTFMWNKETNLKVNVTDWKLKRF